VSSARAAQWGRIEGYHAAAADQLCVVVQIETAQSLDHLEEICSVEGVDVAFIGPMDLATSLGHLAGGTHPDVVAVVESAIGRIVATGVVAGVLAATPELARRYVAAGARFVAAGVDTAILASATTSLRRSLPLS
jgi:4-hydroxy-2-oxoheptanedioate aldolase